MQRRSIKVVLLKALEGLIFILILVSGLRGEFRVSIRVDENDKLEVLGITYNYF